MNKRTVRQEQWAQELERTFMSAYDEYSDALFRHCLIRIRDRELAKDIVQETYSRTWLYLSEGKKVDYLRAFLYRVANNLIVDVSRKKKSASLDAMMEEDGFEVRDENAPEPVDKKALGDALEMLKSLDEMSPREIAAALGVTENVVSVRIHRGIEKLGKLMRGKTGMMAL
jgi:RNA polymerase sigma-70 factor, ECF subfamily